MVLLVEVAENLLEASFSFLDRPELLSLCLTCRTLLPIARRRLFRHIVLKTHQDEKGEPYVVDILRVLHSQCDLTLCVQSLHLLGQKPDPLWPGVNGKDQVFPRKRLFQSIDIVFVQPLKSQSDIAYVGLIAQLHNLQHLKLGFTFSALALKFDKCFGNLCTVEFENDMGALDNVHIFRSIDPCLFMNLCRLPSITNLQLWIPCHQSIPVQFDVSFQMPCLRSLSFQWSVVVPRDLSKLLGNTPNLEKFHLCYTDSIDSDEWKTRPFLCIDQVCRALLRVSGTLKNLKVSIDWTDSENYGPFLVESKSGERTLSWGPSGYLDTLGQFECLEDLDVALVTLLGFWPEQCSAFVLPPCIRRLCLSDDLAFWATYQWDEVLLLCVIRKYLEKRWPLLEQVRLRFQFPQHTNSKGTDPWAKKDSMFGKRFYEICQSAGVEGVIDL